MKSHIHPRPNPHISRANITPLVFRIPPILPILPTSNSLCDLTVLYEAFCLFLSGLFFCSCVLSKIYFPQFSFDCSVLSRVGL